MSAGPEPVATRGSPGRGARAGADALAKGLGLFSIGLGLAELFGARALCRFLGTEGHETLVRAYGAREVATGVAILTSHDPTPWIWGRVAGDALDLATLATAFEAPGRKTDNLVLATAAVAVVTALDVLCVQRLTADQRLAPPGAFEYGDRSGFPRPVHAMRGAAGDFEPPADFRIPPPLRPWQEGAPIA